MTDVPDGRNACQGPGTREALGISAAEGAGVAEHKNEKGGRDAVRAQVGQTGGSCRDSRWGGAPSHLPGGRSTLNG